MASMPFTSSASALNPKLVNIAPAKIAQKNLIELIAV
jgi:hypothetical protein